VNIVPRKKTPQPDERTPHEIIKDKTIQNMTDLGVYKPQYDRLIDIYVDLDIQYETAMGEFARSGFQYETETAAGGMKKSAIVSTLESLRKDILAYSDRLCLNPKAIESVTIEKKSKSKLASMLSTLE